MSDRNTVNAGAIHAGQAIKTISVGLFGPNRPRDPGIIHRAVTKAGTFIGHGITAARDAFERYAHPEQNQAVAPAVEAAPATPPPLPSFDENKGWNMSELENGGR